MADLPSKLDRLLEVLEIIAQEQEITINALAKRLHTKIGSIKIYLDYLEELGLIYRWKDGRSTHIKITADMVAKIGDTMVAAVNGRAIVWRCPFTEICEYYEEGCTTADKCLYLSAVLPAIEEFISKQTSQGSRTSSEKKTEQ